MPPGRQWPAESRALTPARHDAAADRQLVSGPERATAERAHAADKAGRTAAEYRRHIEPATDRERCARARATRAESKRRSIRHDRNTCACRPRMSVDGQRELRTRHGTHDVAVAPAVPGRRSSLRALPRRRDCRRTVRAPVGVDVHRSRHRNTARLISPPAKVLDRRQHSRPDAPSAMPSAMRLVELRTSDRVEGHTIAGPKQERLFAARLVRRKRECGRSRASRRESPHG